MLTCDLNFSFTILKNGMRQISLSPSAENKSAEILKARVSKLCRNNFFDLKACFSLLSKLVHNFGRFASLSLSLPLMSLFSVFNS